MVNLSQRIARFIAFLFILFIRSARPAIIPHWGPPISLSPLNVTKSTPSLSFSYGVGSNFKPIFLKSIAVPLPKSMTNGKLVFLLKLTKSFSSTLLVYPFIVKLLQ